MFDNKDSPVIGSNDEQRVVPINARAIYVRLETIQEFIL
jgi:hypothetical protein